MEKKSTKETVVRYLEENSGTPVSGSHIAEALGISRTAVWKAINSLKAEGYMIDASTGKGYTLRHENDIVSEAGIMKYLGGSGGENAGGADSGRGGAEIIVRDSVTSTNDLLREMAMKGEDEAPEGTMIVAAEQTKGKGRRGRSFFSPEGTGIYFSFLLRPNVEAADAGMITTMAAVAVAEAVKKYGVSDVGIKWVNDVYVGGRKVCGILAEATTSLETGEIDSVVVGIGLNIYTPEGGFPDDIKDRAGSILGTERADDARNRLVAYTYEQFFDLYRNASEKEIAERYRSMCFVIGKKITIIKGNEQRHGTAVSLDDRCHLLVRYEDGTEESLFSGEISLRMDQ